MPAVFWDNVTEVPEIAVTVVFLRMFPPETDMPTLILLFDAVRVIEVVWPVHVAA